MSALPLDFPTDRWQNSPDLGVGVDTITFAGPTDEALLEELHFQQLSRAIDYDTGEVVDRRLGSRSTITVGLARARVKGKRIGGSPIISIEASLPTMLKGHNRDPLRRDMLVDAVETVLHLLREELPGIPRLEDTWPQRLDLTRDFHGVDSPALTLEALARRHIAHARVNSQHRRPDNTLQTLFRGSPSQYMIRGYAKGVELAESARRANDPDVRRLLLAWAEVSRHQLRFEVQLHRPALNRRGVHKMTDCTPEVLRALALEYYRLAGWSAPIGGGRENLAEAISEATSTLRPSQQRNLLAYVFARMIGIDPPMARHAIERVRPLVNRHHLLDPAEEAPKRRLDFEAGRESDA